MALISASIDNAHDLSFLCGLVYPKIDEEILDGQSMDALAVPGFFFRQRRTIGKLVQRKDFFRQGVQHLCSCARSLEGKADIISDFTKILFCLLGQLYNVLSGIYRISRFKSANTSEARRD